MYSSMQGGGSLMEMDLLQDVKLNLTKDRYPCFRLKPEKYGKDCDYSMKQVYGVCNSFFGNPLNIIVPAQIPQMT